jgi:hypothetical protein
MLFTSIQQELAFINSSNITNNNAGRHMKSRTMQL